MLPPSICCKSQLVTCREIWWRWSRPASIAPPGVTDYDIWKKAWSQLTTNEMQNCGMKYKKRLYNEMNYVRILTFQNSCHTSTKLFFSELHKYFLLLHVTSIHSAFENKHGRFYRVNLKTCFVCLWVLPTTWFIRQCIYILFTVVVPTELWSTIIRPDVKN